MTVYIVTLIIMDHIVSNEFAQICSALFCANMTPFVIKYYTGRYGTISTHDVIKFTVVIVIFCFVFTKLLCKQDISAKKQGKKSKTT